MTYKFNHNGVNYSLEDMEVGDDDCRKVIYYVYNLDTKESTHIDWSPYSSISMRYVKLWIDLGMPTRRDINSIGPMSESDLDNIQKQRMG